uniref:Metalloendopeptidase n=1 Tax=Myripristis murdjan TaxID=586833 RepID=A0A667Y542_9TELE
QYKIYYIMQFISNFFCFTYSCIYSFISNTIDDDEFSVSALIEKANANIGMLLMFGDIVVHTGLRNADPCTARDCLWPKSSDGNVYVPYRISNEYSQKERDIIMEGLRSFSRSTCIRFTRRERQRDFLDIQSRSGCYSSVGRRDGGQVLSLQRSGCVYHHVIQHELLHALGFNHEQTRSDRDEHVRIVLENVKCGKEHNFRKIEDSRNLDTPYDYGSLMHYGRYFFSRNGQPTIVPVPDPDVCIGTARQMSPTDILRVNRLYACSTKKFDLLIPQ